MKEDSNDKQSRLLDNAFKLFTQKGVKDTSIQEIVDGADVAKGTFYLYFKDKYDLRNMLIAKKAAQLFRKADDELSQTDINNIFDEVIFIVNSIINQLCDNPSLLSFISKNLSWGIFKTSLIHPTDDDELYFYNIYTRITNRTDVQFKNPEIMLFMITELVSSTCYSAILYSEPVDIEELKPYLFDGVRGIMERHRIES